MAATKHKTESNGRGKVPSRPGDAAERCELDVLDSKEAAKSAGLVFVSDDQPGVHRKRVGKYFTYIAPDGTTINDPSERARFKALAIPPAWTDVWICQRANGHLQATGRDDRCRKQYRYHPKWRIVRDETKYARMLDFGHALPRIRSNVDGDLRCSGLRREKVIAAVVALLQQTLIRVGNEEYARANGSYGLTTMRDDNVDVNGAAINFVFHGKSGREHEIGLRDRRLAQIVRRCRDLPGQILFQYVDEDGNTHAVGSTDVNEYLRDASGSDFTAKDFRTWYGTVLAAQQLVGDDPDMTQQEKSHRVVEAVAEVAQRLGNTPVVCRKCYIHPLLIDAYLEGALNQFTQGIGNQPAGDDYSSQELLVLRLLEAESSTT